MNYSIVDILINLYLPINYDLKWIIFDAVFRWSSELMIFIFVIIFLYPLLRAIILMVSVFHRDFTDIVLIDST